MRSDGKSSRFQSPPVRYYSIFFSLIFLFFTFKAVSASSTLAFPQYDQTEPPPQQSTTGPTPPLEVLINDAKKQLQATHFAESEHILSVPSYLWRHGCGPTAVGMVVGYYDSIGYSDLVSGSPWEQSLGVDQMIASGGSESSNWPGGTYGHFEDYASPIDSYPVMIPDAISAGRNPHPNDSLADFMDTSKSTRYNYYGWSWSSDIGPSFRDYVNMRNSSYQPTYREYYQLDWSVLTSEINNGRPMVFLVDSDGDGLTDHFITVIGYSDQPSQQYAVWDTWTTSLRWEYFRPIKYGDLWGIWGGWSFSLKPLTKTFLPLILQFTSAGSIVP